MKTKNIVKVGIIAMVGMAVGLLVPVATASVIGTLDTGSGGGISVNLTSITWNTNPASDPPGPPWNGEVANTTTLMFAGCGGVLGAPGCLDVAPNAPDEAVEINGNVPLTAATVLPEPGFLRFSGNGTTHVAINYTLTQVLAGSGNANCAGLAQFQSCSVFVGSPIVLTLEGPGTVATLNLSGTVSDGVGAISNWTGKFSATFPTTTPAALQTFVLGGGTETTSNSGSFFATTVPEPSYTVVLIGAGLIGLASLVRRKRA